MWLHQDRVSRISGNGRFRHLFNIIRRTSEDGTCGKGWLLFGGPKLGFCDRQSTGSYLWRYHHRQYNMAMGLLVEVSCVSPLVLSKSCVLLTQLTSAPGAGVAIIVLIFTVPQIHIEGGLLGGLKRFDIIGGILSVAWSVPLIFALQEAGELYPWDSGPIIATLVLGLVLLLVFGLYEAWLTRHSRYEPTFPIVFLVDGTVSMIMLCVIPHPNH